MQKKTVRLENLILIYTVCVSELMRMMCYKQLGLSGSTVSAVGEFMRIV